MQEITRLCLRREPVPRGALEEKNRTSRGLIAEVDVVEAQTSCRTRRQLDIDLPRRTAGWQVDDFLVRTPQRGAAELEAALGYFDKQVPRVVGGHLLRHARSP